jgi:pimeloyl-ACP methyl ester carboxylesterase
MSSGVVLLHGIFRTKRSMRKMARFIEDAGYQVLNLGYPSTKYSIENLVDIIHQEINQFSSKIDGQIHFVGYSMGGLLIRAYLKKYRPQNLGRVVMVGTPNYGSEVADKLKNLTLYKMLYGPAGQQLTTSQEAFSDIFTTDKFELGIIAGNKSIDPISSWIIGRPNDGKVSIESTKLDWAKDHIVLPLSHTFFPSSRKMWGEALSFLQKGEFLRN